MDDMKAYLKGVLASINTALAVSDGKPQDQVTEALSILDQGVESVKNEHFKTLVALKECEIRIANAQERLADLNEKAKASVREGDEDAASLYIEDMRDVEAEVAPYQELLPELREASDHLEQQKKFLERKSGQLRQSRQKMTVRATLMDAQSMAGEVRRLLDQLVREVQDASIAQEATQAATAHTDEGIRRVRTEQRAESRWVEEHLQRLKRECASPSETDRS
ncbi:PspA/IM30 family protein [Streptomyces sp. NBC_01214]|uniref:PspA/IM30 family protein n=1 Tax=Streptomyces sp. NBC_01214 TaxID=2903777 RepID=UPI00224CC234|nr:hypothetical protein [Streptomyces sp. NBC_01214]MCX4801828.1 PspA/IM30 family protein [Streptomyces sp. NBC_01214]